jgi:hypothetical protein
MISVRFSCGLYLAADQGNGQGCLAHGVERNARASLATAVKQSHLGKGAKRPVHGDSRTAKFNSKIGLIRD